MKGRKLNKFIKKIREDDKRLEGILKRMRKKGLKKELKESGVFFVLLKFTRMVREVENDISSMEKNFQDLWTRFYNIETFIKKQVNCEIQTLLRSAEGKEAVKFELEDLTAIHIRIEKMQKDIYEMQMQNDGRKNKTVLFGYSLLRVLIGVILVLFLASCGAEYVEFSEPAMSGSRAFEVICIDNVEYIYWHKGSVTSSASGYLAPHFKPDGSLYTCEMLTR